MASGTASGSEVSRPALRRDVKVRPLPDAHQPPSRGGLSSVQRKFPPTVGGRHAHSARPSDDPRQHARARRVQDMTFPLDPPSSLRRYWPAAVRAMFVIAPLLVGSHLLAVADSVPVFDIKRSCQRRDVAAVFGGRSSDTVCIRSEKEARDQLKNIWGETRRC